MSELPLRPTWPTLIALFLSTLAAAQNPLPAEPESLPRNTPRELFRSFLISAWNVESNPASKVPLALECLDTSEIAYEDYQVEGLKKVQQLATILDEFPAFDLLKIRDDNRHATERYAIPDLPGRVLVLTRTDAFDDQWVFDLDTVNALEELSAAVIEARKSRSEATDEQLAAVPAARRTPRATMDTFLKAAAEQRYAEAAECFDLSSIQAAIRDEEGRTMTDTMLFCISRLGPVVLQTIPRDPVYKPSPYPWRTRDQYSISLNRIESGDDAGQWKFSARTVATLRDLATVLGDAAPTTMGTQTTTAVKVPWGIRLRQAIPDSLEREHFFIEDWQWLALLSLVTLGVVGEFIVALILGYMVKLYYERVSSTSMEKRLRRQFVRPIGWLAMALLWWIGLRFLDLDHSVLAVLLGAVKFFAAVAGVWSCYRLADLIAGMLESRASRTTSKYDDLLVPLIRKSLKIFVTVFGVVFIADTMDWKIHTLLTGLGIGGLAVAFAARETLGNILGSLTVLLDRPFHIGDWVKIGNTEGTVEAVGFRSTRIRTFYNSVITIPNSDCVNHAIDNMGSRTYRRYSCHISVVYATTPDQLEAFCEGIRELIRRHPYTRKDYFHVYVHNFAASSIDILLYCFWHAPDWGTELRERQRLLIDIKRLAEGLGVDFAFPTQTLHLQQDAASRAIPELGETPAQTGIRDARRIVQENLGPPGKPPPPVTFEIRPFIGGEDDGGA